MIHSLRYHSIFNILAYYTIWFSCILSAADHQSWIGITVSMIIILIQIFCQLSLLENAVSFAKLIFNMAICGLLIDSVLLWTGVISYRDNLFTPYLAPPWMTLLWIEFGIICHLTLKRLWNKPLLNGALSFAGFYCAYIAAEALGAADLLLGWQSAAAVGLIWMVLLPFLLWNHHKRVLQS